MDLATKAAELAAGNKKPALVDLARAAGWKGDPARTSKETLAQIVAHARAGQPFDAPKADRTACNTAPLASILQDEIRKAVRAELAPIAEQIRTELLAALLRGRASE